VGEVRRLVIERAPGAGAARPSRGVGNVPIPQPGIHTDRRLVQTDPRIVAGQRAAKVSSRSKAAVEPRRIGQTVDEVARSFMVSEPWQSGS
jgi:hypothetical protein